jgi:hypothetical protein
MISERASDCKFRSSGWKKLVLKAWNQKIRIIESQYLGNRKRFAEAMNTPNTTYPVLSYDKGNV